MEGPRVNTDTSKNCASHSFHNLVRHSNSGRRLPPLYSSLTIFSHLLLFINHICPFEELCQHKPMYKVLKVSSCASFPHLQPYNRHKLNFHTSRCVFIGYSVSDKGYRCLRSSMRSHSAKDVSISCQHLLII